SRVMSDIAAARSGVLLIGLTGGIGSGKTTIAARMAHLGAVVIDADRLSREVVAVGTPGLDAVRAEFGDEILLGDGSLDRQRMATLVFGDAAARGRLNAIVHPLVRERATEEIAAVPAGSVVVNDVPLLVENQMAACYHLIVAALVDRGRRLERLTARGMAADLAGARIDAQATDRQRLDVADVVIDNDGPLDETLQQVDALWRHRLLPFRDNLVAEKAAELPVQLEPYDPQWVQRYWRVARRLRAALSPALVALEHVGATAVPGSQARDVVDIRAWVKSSLDVPAALASYGWFPIGRGWRVPRFAGADVHDSVQLFVHTGT
ncbi:MAG: dephospho-CoA kinase, partial [Terriglobales bacterium]